MKNASKFVTLEQLEKLVSLNPDNLYSSTKENMIKVKQIVNQLSILNIKAKDLYTVEVHDNKTYFEHGVYCIIDAPTDHQNMIIRINFDTHTKKYSIHTLNTWEYCDNSEADRVRKELNINEPQTIGVLTAKKVQIWINYHTAIFIACEQRAKENENKINEFLKELEQFPQTKEQYNTKDNILHLFERSNNQTGYIRKNGIEFSFEIHKGSGFVSKKIELRADNNTIETFNNLSNNKYISTKDGY